MAKNIINMIHSITNVGKPHFSVDLEGNGVYTKYAVLAKNAIEDNAPALTLYSFDIKSGVATPRRVVMPAIRTKASFAAAFAGDWYRVQFEKANEYHNNFANIAEELSDDEQKAVDALHERYDIVRDVYNAHEKGKNAACPTVKNFVACLAKLPLNKYSPDVQAAYKELKAAYEALNRTGDTININKKDKNGNENGFYSKVKILIAALWNESPNCVAYRFNTNKTLAHEVYQRAYAGRRTDADGKVVKDTNINERAVLSEIVLAALEALQNKAPEAPVAADDSNK